MRRDYYYKAASKERQANQYAADRREREKAAADKRKQAQASQTPAAGGWDK